MESFSSWTSGLARHAEMADSIFYLLKLHMGSNMLFQPPGLIPEPRSATEVRLEMVPQSDLKVFDKTHPEPYSQLQVPRPVTR